MDRLTDKGMVHFRQVAGPTLRDPKNGTPCGECQTSCQSACKTSCTVANQPCKS